MNDHQKALLFSRLSIILIGIASAAFVVTVYHWIVIGWCNQWLNRNGRRRPLAFRSEQAEVPSSFENSMVQLIPAHKYQKGVGLAGEDGTCAVCLSEFEEGEDLRTLPECMHSFHVPCIDMWLYSHSNCPMCRTEATPSPQIFQVLPEYGSGEPEPQLESNVFPAIIVQSRML